MTASSNIPNSISPDELAKLAQSAQEDVTETPKSEVTTYGKNDMTEEDIYELVGDKLQEISDACDHPVSHKLATIIILNNMIDWHKRMSEIMMKDGEFEAAAGWSRDAGKFQAIMNILFTIEISNDDFTAMDWASCPLTGALVSRVLCN